MNKPQIVGWAMPIDFAPRLFEKLWALTVLLKIAVSKQEQTGISVLLYSLFIFLQKIHES